MFEYAAAAAFFKALTGYSLEDQQLLFEVFDTSGLHRDQSNRRLALLGDKAMGLVLVNDWYPTNAPRGDADRILQAVAANGNLERVANAAGIGQHVIVNPGHVGPITGKILVTTLEAMLGAVWFHSRGNLDAVRTAMTSIGLIHEHQ